MKGATKLPITKIRLPKFQSTLPVKGATGINLEEIKDKDEFQSTLPVKGATNPNMPVSLF
ncbi:hypothetical protein CLONEX_02501 [[Clostridium] nexile DSM 1787]|nr:hypothetical protein CLONEX_02501 [[Clostridium] nexile DSM 1787]